MKWPIMQEINSNSIKSKIVRFPNCEFVVCLVSDIHTKYDYLEIKKRLNKTDLVAALRLFRRYNLIEATGDLSTSSCRIVIMPTILLAIPAEDINSLYQTINRIKQGGEEE